MSNEGTYAREHQLHGRRFGSRAQEVGMDQGQATGISTSNPFLVGTSSGLGLDEVISNCVHPTASLGKRTRPKLEDGGEPMVINNALHQQQIFPPFVAKVERDFQAPEQPNLSHVSQHTLHPEMFYQAGNMEMGPNYGSVFPVAAPTAQGTVTSLGYGNYNLPIPNFTADLHGDSSSSVQLPPVQESCPQNPYGAANGAPPPCFPTTKWINNPSLQQPQYSQLSTGLGGVTQEMRQSIGLSRFCPGGRCSNNGTHSSNIQQQQGPMGNIHLIPKLEMGESSSRNVRMRMTLPDNTQQSTKLQAGSFINPITTQGNGNPLLPRIMRNSLYDPMYERMGLPVDPHLRMLVLCRQEGKAM